MLIHEITLITITLIYRLPRNSFTNYKLRICILAQKLLFLVHYNERKKKTVKLLY